MITCASEGGFFHFRGLSTDAKPASKDLNGADFYEMDTGAVYMFDADSLTWLEQ